MKHKKIEIPPRPDWYRYDQISENQTIVIPWSGQHNSKWNEICADVVEVFGLPGNRFYYKPYVNFMTFTFKSTKDAELCRILLSEKIPNTEIQT